MHAYCAAFGLQLYSFTTPTFTTLARSAPGAPHNCSSCYDPESRTAFWGFATAIVNADALANGSDPRIKPLVQQARVVCALVSCVAVVCACG